MVDQIKRREMLFGAGAALLATESIGANEGTSNSWSETEKANVKLFREYQAIFDAPSHDVDSIMKRFLAPDVSGRWFDDEPKFEGRDAAVKAATKDGGNDLDGVRIKAHILQLFVRGPLVASSRIDTIKRPGKPDEVVKIAGVCIVKDGMIHEYCDYIIT